MTTRTVNFTCPACGDVTTHEVSYHPFLSISGRSAFSARPKGSDKEMQAIESRGFSTCDKCGTDLAYAFSVVPVVKVVAM